METDNKTVNDTLKAADKLAELLRKRMPSKAEEKALVRYLTLRKKHAALPLDKEQN